MKYELEHAHRLSCACKTPSCKFSRQARTENRYVIATKRQPGGRTEILAQAEIRLRTKINHIDLILM